MTTRKKLFAAVLSKIPVKRITSVVEWMRINFKPVGSAFGDKYLPEVTPWTMEPTECADNGTETMTFVKPVQAGGSMAGEGAIDYWLSTQQSGDVQYNWPTDKKANERWSKRVEKIMKACAPLMARTDPARFKWNTGLVIFPHCNFIMQGIYTANAVQSDAIRFQVNEEVHDDSATSGWKDEGRLDQAYARCTSFWNSVIFNISNAGKRGGQLHKAFLAGTMQRWQVKCPGCGQYHALRMRWDDKHPELGGLRYDSEKHRRADGGLDYFGLQSTVRYQMPCGAIVHDDVTERRALSLSGRYSAPTNTGALLVNRSYTLESVSVDYIPWLDLIKQKDEALKSLKWGKGDAWWTYLREKECQFTSAGDRPVMEKIVLSGKKKQRAGLANRRLRVGLGDYQRGKAKDNELPHWWFTIIDVAITEDGKLHVLIVDEGKLTTDANLTDKFKSFDVVPSCVALDSGWDTKHVYLIAMTEGYYVVKDEDTLLFAGHEDGSKKIYSPPKPLHAMINQGPKFDYVATGKGEFEPDLHEPMFVRVSKLGMMDRLSWMRGTPARCIFEVPADVSDDFVAHMDAWQVEQRVNKRTNETETFWAQRRDDDHLYKCCCYAAVLIEDAGLFGGEQFENKEGDSNDEEKKDIEENGTGDAQA